MNEGRVLGNAGDNSEREYYILSLPPEKYAIMIKEELIFNAKYMGTFHSDMVYIFTSMLYTSSPNATPLNIAM
jgi:hypothetical protein